MEYTEQKHLINTGKSKEEASISRIKEYKPTYISFSGGKDSVVLYDLVKKAGISCSIHYHFTTVDPPELVQFIKLNYSDIIWDRPELSMFQLIEKKGFPPTRQIRYCCEKLKEYGGKGEIVCTGIRWEESARRSQRPIYEESYKGKKQRFLHPIADWSTKEIWDYIKKNNLPYCSLYNEGFTRIGCIMCPLQRKENIERERERYPKFYRAYIRAFDRAIKNKPNLTINSQHKTAEDMMYWWINGYEKDLQTRQKVLSQFGIDIFEQDLGCGSSGDGRFD